MAAKGGFAARIFAAHLVELRLGSNGMRRALAPQGRIVPCMAASGCIVAHPRSLHVTVSEGIAGALRHVYLVCRELQAAIFNARVDRQMQPFAGVLILRAAGCSSQRRLRRRASLLGRNLHQNHMAIDSR